MAVHRTIGVRVEYFRAASLGSPSLDGHLVWSFGARIHVRDLGCHETGGEGEMTGIPFTAMCIPADTEANRAHAERHGVPMVFPPPVVPASPAICAACGGRVWMSDEARTEYARAIFMGMRGFVVCVTCFIIHLRGDHD